MLLVLDTCFNACSAALYDEGAARVVASGYEAMERGHAEALGLMVERLFVETGIQPDRLSRIVVTYGPGSFTGLRIGLSFAKGMALALDIPLVGIDSLEATAAAHFGAGKKFVVAHKAGGTGLYYWSSFDGARLSPPALGSAEIFSSLGAQYIDARLDAKDFAAYAAGLPVTTIAVAPLYLRPPDAKPSISIAAASAHVRLASTGDVAVMADIHAQSFAKGWTQADLTSMLAVPGAGALVVELAGTLYGFVQYQWVEGEAEINTICVSPNYRRQHFGRDLLDALLTHLTLGKTSKVFLEVAANNAAALGLYETYGFGRSGTRKAYYADGTDAIAMVRVLTP
jgi:tRNA threonylcarbamoyl adenosine modification protein YeaZ/ribosomal-protein-alanine acetyltransferase